MTLINKAEVQSAVRAYLVHESSEIAQNVEQIIAALPARGVKPLEWRDSSIPANAVCHSITTFGTYFIETYCDGWFLVEHDNNGVGRYKTLEAAKAAAQADYEARILAALSPAAQPGADVAAQAREAAEEAVSTVPDHIELYRIIKRSGTRKHSDIARVISERLEPMRRAFAALIVEPSERTDAREAALREALDAVDNERLTDKTGEPDDEAYNSAIDDAYDAILALIGEPR